MVALRDFYFNPIFATCKVRGLSDFLFWMLVLSTIMIAAAGYVINDYFDIRTDRINKPERMILGKHINRRKGIFMHALFNIIAILISIYIAYKVNKIELVIVHLIAGFLLWRYAVKWKKLFFANFLIAFLSAFVVIELWLFEWAALKEINRHEVLFSTQNISFIVSFTIFAFLVSLNREMIKDMADVEGDKKIGSRSLPLLLGFAPVKTFVFFLNKVIIAGLIYFVFFYSPLLVFQKTYVIVFLIAPLTLSSIFIFSAAKRRDFLVLSNIFKVVMLFGILLLPVICI